MDIAGSDRGAVPSAELATVLADAKTMLEAHPVGQAVLAARLGALRERLLGERLQLAVLGQFKRGKSTFINALLGTPILPVAVVPLTAVAIFISWGAEPVARVFFKGGQRPEELHHDEPQAIQEFLSRFVAEDRNPKNRLGVSRVELRYPASILAKGTVLIDTPGVGSSHQHNTESALRVLPECDAAIFIVSADPPITEIDYLQRIKVKATRIFYVLNKMDYLEPGERKVALDFLRKVLTERSLLEPSADIFGISAHEALNAKQSQDRDRLKASGIGAVEDHLLHYIATEKNRALDQAVRAKATDILFEAVADAELRTQTLRLPIKTLTGKARAFEKALQAIEEQRLTMRDLLGGDKRRLMEALEKRIGEIREEVSAELSQVVEQSLAGDNPGEWERKARAALSPVLQTFFERERDRLSEEFAAETTKVLALHQKRLDGLVDSVRRTAAEIFDVSFASQHEQDTFALGEDPYWMTESIKVTLVPDAGRVIDHLVPLGVRRARLQARIMQQANDLVIRNAENLRWAIRRGIDDTMLQAGEHLEDRLNHAIAATKGVIEDALTRRENRSSETETEVADLGRFIAGLRKVREALANIPVAAGEPTPAI
jgi:GTP-binding protein EngB required for normal cell division